MELSLPLDGQKETQEKGGGFLAVGSHGDRRFGSAIRGMLRSTNHSAASPSRWIATSAGYSSGPLLTVRAVQNSVFFHHSNKQIRHPCLTINLTNETDCGGSKSYTPAAVGLVG